jgi:hypothetical protein
MTSIHESSIAAQRAAREDSRPVSALISDALRQLSQLLRNETALAKAEVAENARNALRGGAMLGAAAVVALPAMFILMLALAAFMTEYGLAPSLSYLITAGVGFVIAAILAKVGMNRLKADMLMPNRTINQLQRDAATMKAHMQGQDG